MNKQKHPSEVSRIRSRPVEPALLLFEATEHVVERSPTWVKTRPERAELGPDSVKTCLGPLEETPNLAEPISYSVEISPFLSNAAYIWSTPRSTSPNIAQHWPRPSHTAGQTHQAGRTYPLNPMGFGDLMGCADPGKCHLRSTTRGRKSEPALGGGAQSLATDLVR